MLRSRPTGLRATGVAALLALAAVPGCGLVTGGGDEFAAGDAERAVDPAEVAGLIIDAPDIRRHVGFLSSDVMRGRATPSEELDRAAAWIGEQFRGSGFEPAGEHGGFMQLWQLPDPDLDPDTARAPNVVAVMPGSDPRLSGEYVIVAAHFDHLGVGEPTEDGDSIYNGADDNASGVAAMIEIAQAFGALRRPPVRPLLFLAFSGQEDGLLGSSWFVRSPTVLLSGAVAVLNLDMVGRNHPDTVGLVGYDYSTLGPRLQRIAAETDGLGLSVDTDPVPGEDLFRRGDHFPFAQIGIPGLTVTTALHDDHHRPTDEAGRIDADKAARVARLVFLAAYALANEGVTPEWTGEGARAVEGASSPDR